MGLRDASASKNSFHSRGYHASTSPRDFLKKRYDSPLLSKATKRIYSKEVRLMMMLDIMQMIWCVKFKHCIGICLLVFKGIVHNFFSLIKSHILGYDGVWYSSFWSEASRNHLN